MPGDVWTSGLSGSFVGSGLDRFSAMGHGSQMNLDASAIPTAISADANLTLEFAFLSLSLGNRTGMTLCLQMNGSDTSLLISTSVSGFFETTAGTTVTVTPTDTLAWRLNGGSGGSANMTPAQVGVRVTHASKFYTRPGCGGGATLSVSSTTRYLPIMGSLEFQSTESSIQAKWPAAATAEKINTTVTANARTTASTIVLRRGGADAGSAITIPNGTTGSFEGSLSQSIAAGDQVNFAVTTGTGGSQALTLSAARVLLASTANNTNAVGSSPTTIVSATRYSLPVGDFSPSASLGSGQLSRTRRSGRMTSLGARIPTMGAASWEIAVQTSAPADTALVLSLAASTTGYFDTAATVTVTASDVYTLNSQRVSGSGNMTVGLVVLGTDEPASGGTTFTKTVTGSLSMAGTLARRLAAKKTLTGSLSLAGTVARRLAYKRTLTAQLQLQGAVGRMVAFKKTLTAQLQLQGLLTRKVSKALAGQLGFTGTAGKVFFKGLAGALSFTGDVARLKSLSKGLAGTLSLAGAVRRTTGKHLAGTLSLAGALHKNSTRFLVGSLSLVGSLRRQTGKKLAGVLMFSATAVGVKTGTTFQKALAGILSFTSTLGRQYIDNPEPEPGTDSWWLRVRRRWGR